MLFIHSSQIRYRRAPEKLFLSFVILLFLVPVSVYPQGSGRASNGTGGNHVIQGYVFFPSGRRAEGSIQIKLQSYSAGEITVLADTSGSFTFAGLAPGFIGLYQVNVTIPVGTPPGLSIPLMLKVNGQQSNPVLVALQ